MGCVSQVQTSDTPQPTKTLVPIDQAIAILEDPNSQGDDLAYGAAELARWGPAAAPAVPALRQSLRYPYSRDARFASAEALGAIGPPAVEAVPDLVEALSDEHDAIRYQSAYALGSIGKPARCAVPVLAGLLWDPERQVRIYAAGAIDVIAGVDLVDEVHEPRPGWPARVRLGWSENEEQQISTYARAWWMEKGQYMNWSEEGDLCSPSEL